ncbi:iron-sulfur cluster insertion protein ErpA [Kangiella sp. TOML190]|uniref:iron-sulfur cluster insertion protein ErpA n=1 Tax=Kangiella sp. TOML190 TaxID=2931351 RepID=UPI00203E11EF|nr:iron-sulfur cluster insertion protein ErpA [Kangiella sp. TOML190]
MNISVTQAATDKVRTLIEEEENFELKLRVFVTGGGCSGFQYGFSFDEQQKENDMLIEQGGVKVLIDHLSYQYLMGSEIDYTEGLQGSRFLINNPMAKSTCGCGSSFTI